MNPSPDASLATRARAMKPRAFALELIKGCNLRCGYCYYAAREDAYDPSAVMSADTAERSIDMLVDQGPDGEPLHVHLFGGEPLLELGLVKHVVRYGEERAAAAGKTMTFELTTNGTRLTAEVVEFLDEHRIRVGVSFDGPPEVQDAARPAMAGSSYAKVIPGIERLIASRRGSPELMALTHCSVVVTRRELDLARIVRHVEGLGFTKILLTPATDLEGRSDGIAPEDLPRVLAAYDELADDYEQRMLAGRPVALSWFPMLMGRLLSGRRKTFFCGGGRDYLGITADGDAHLCFRFYEDDDFRMGSVHEGLERSVTERLLGLPLEKRTSCSTCWARYFCGGGCHHDNLVTTGGLGDPNPVTCEILRHTMGRTLEMHARLTRAGRLPGRSSVAAAEEHGMQDQQPGFGDDDRPRRRDTCHVRNLDGEQVVYEPTSHEVVILNPTARFILDLCDGSHRVADILDALARRYDAPVEHLRSDLLATLGDLSSKAVIEK